MKISPYIFRGYDIRGIYGEDLNEEVADKVGKAYGTFIKEHGENTVIVGRDNRESSESLQTALINGIISTGANVINIGLVTTPIYYYSRELYNIKPGIMVTASHNPAEYNGFKMSSYNDERMFGEQLQWFRKQIEIEDFITGMGNVEKREPIKEYVKEITSKIKIEDKKIKVVVDCGNASGGLVAKDIYEGIGCEVIPLYCNLDSTFPNHHPDPAVAENLQDLIKKVKETGAALGIGIDGDADRIGIVDEKGGILFGDKFQMVMFKEILPKYPNVKVPVEVKCTKALFEEAERLGGRPFYHRTGNACLYKTIKEEKLPFVGEMSGHVFFADEYFGFDDGIYAGARFIRYLSNTNKKCSELLEDEKEYPITPEIKYKTEDSIKFEQVDKAKEYLRKKDYEIIDVDGVRAITPNGWILIRASNTSPNLTIRAEAETEEELEELKKEIDEVIEYIK